MQFRGRSFDQRERGQPSGQGFQARMALQQQQGQGSGPVAQAGAAQPAGQPPNTGLPQQPPPPQSPNTGTGGSNWDRASDFSPENISNRIIEKEQIDRDYARHQQGVFQDFFPQQRDTAQGLPNPADPFGSVIPGAQGQLNSVFGGGTFQSGNNQFLDMGAQMLGGSQLPQAPSLDPINTQFNTPGAPQFQQGNFQGPNIGGPFQSQQFDPNSVQGPNVQQVQAQQLQAPGQVSAQQINPQQVNAQQVGAPNVGGIQGPNANQQSLSDLVQMGLGAGQTQNIAREQFGGGGQFGGSGIGQQAFQSALDAQQGLAGTTAADTQAKMAEARKAIFADAALAGSNQAGSRGFGPSGSVGGMAIGKQLGLSASRLAGESNQAFLTAQGQALGARQAGASGLTGLGSAASGALQGQQGLNLQSGLGFGGLNVQQRGQDVDMARLGQQGGAAGMAGVASLLNASNQGQANAFGQATNRMGVLGGQQLQAGLANQGANLQGQLANQGAGLQAGQFNQGADLNAQQFNSQMGFNVGQANQNAGLQAGMANQSAGLQGFGLGTQRQGVQGGIYNQGQQIGSNAFNNFQQNQIGAFGAGTQRGIGQGQVGIGQANTQLGFGQLGLQGQQAGANAQATNNQQAIDLYGTQGGLANQRFGQQLGGAADFANIQQQGGIAQGQQQLDAAGIASGLLSGNAQAQGQYNDLQQRATAGDQDAQIQLTELDRDIAQQRWMQGQQGAIDRRGQNLGLIGDIAGGIGKIFSDRNAKENIEPVDTAGIAERFAGLPVSRWNYKGDKTPHIGPMAQDFKAQFDLGGDGTTISVIDALGVVMVGMKDIMNRLDALEKRAA